jgi:hypothetical protein
VAEPGRGLLLTPVKGRCLQKRTRPIAVPVWGPQGSQRWFGRLLTRRSRRPRGHEGRLRSRRRHHCGADKVGAEVDGGVDESGSGGEEATVAATAIAAGRGDEEAGLNGGAGTGAVAAGAAGGRPVASVVDREAG